jgi:hypothetical protein
MNVACDEMEGATPRLPGWKISRFFQLRERLKAVSRRVN